MTNHNISFVPSTSKKEIEEIYNFNVLVFADSQDFTWTKDNIANELKDGWKLYSVKSEKDIICVLFIKLDNNKLLTKNTPVKLNYQGNGLSHLIKEFYEQYAGEKGVSTIINYCPDDNFRMISLNEGHDYQKTGNVLGENENILEWIKNLK